MNKTKIYRVILFFIPIFLLYQCGRSDEKKEIEKVYSSYKSALIKRDYKSAALYFDTATINYYYNILQLAKYADSEKVASMNVFDQLNILMARMSFSKKEIEKINTSTFIESLYQTGMVSSQEIIQMNLYKLKIDQNIAIGIILNDSNAKHLDIDKNKTDNYPQFSFVKENKKWKINLIQIFGLADKVLKKEMKDAGLNKQEFISLVISELKPEYNLEDENELWKPKISN